MMVKKIAMACLLMGLGSTLNAVEVSNTKTLIGLEVGYAEVQGDIVESGLNPHYKSNDVMYGLRIGAQNDEWRTMLVFDYYDNEDYEQNLEQGLLTLDYFFMQDKSSIKPYFGVNVGYANYESDFVDESGFLYGGQVGVVFDVADNLDVDLGYRYSLSSMDTFDHAGTFMFGINYKL